MSRNGSGTYVLPEPAFVPNTPISSAAVNSDFSDIADALTDSLARDGQGGMTAVLPLSNTGFTYLTDPNTGMRRTGADTQAIQCGGVDVITATPTGVSITGTLAVSGTFTVGGSPLLLIGEMKIWPGLTAPSKWVFANGGALLRASFPDLWAFAQTEIAGGNTLFTNGNGTTTFTVPDLRGRVPAGDDNMGGGVGAGRLTSTTMTPDGETLGAVGGTQTQTILTANLPAYTPTGTVTLNTLGLNTRSGNASTSNSSTSVFEGNSSQTLSSPNNAIYSGGASLTFAGVAQGGTSTPVNKIQPTIVTNFIIYAGA
jgi:microcystin-dependent protein